MTLLVALVSIVLSLFINSIAGYAFARLDFPFKKVIWVLIVPGLASAYNIFFVKQFYTGFPKDYDEAARVNLAPTVSSTLTLVLGDALAISSSNSYNFKREDFFKYHPNGALGEALRKEIK